MVTLLFHEESQSSKHLLIHSNSFPELKKGDFIKVSLIEQVLNEPNFLIFQVDFFDKPSRMQAEGFVCKGSHKRFLFASTYLMLLLCERSSKFPSQR